MAHVLPRKNRRANWIELYNEIVVLSCVVHQFSALFYQTNAEVGYSIGTSLIIIVTTLLLSNLSIVMFFAGRLLFLFGLKYQRIWSKYLKAQLEARRIRLSLQGVKIPDIKVPEIPKLPSLPSAPDINIAKTTQQTR